MIIDFHTHCFPDALAERAMSSMSAQSGLQYYADGTEKGLRASMKEAGIACSVLCSIAVKPGQYLKTNAYASRFLQQEQKADSHILPFASVHPNDENWRELLWEIKAQGFQGIKLHPDYQGFFVDDPGLEPFYRELGKLGLVVVYHAGLDLGLPDPVHASPKRLAEVIDLLEGCTTVLAHMGSHVVEKTVLEELCGRDVYFDTSFALERMDQDLARAVFRKHGPQRMLFGSDSPWDSQKDSVAFFRQFAKGFLSPEDSQRVLCGNAAQLLHMESSAAQDL